MPYLARVLELFVLIKTVEKLICILSHAPPGQGMVTMKSIEEGKQELQRSVNQLFALVDQKINSEPDSKSVTVIEKEKLQILQEDSARVKDLVDANERLANELESLRTATAQDESIKYDKISPLRKSGFKLNRPKSLDSDILRANCITGFKELPDFQTSNSSNQKTDYQRLVQKYHILSENCNQLQEAWKRIELKLREQKQKCQDWASLLDRKNAYIQEKNRTIKNLELEVKELKYALSETNTAMIGPTKELNYFTQSSDSDNEKNTSLALSDQNNGRDPDASINLELMNSDISDNKSPSGMGVHQPLLPALPILSDNNDCRSSEMKSCEKCYISSTAGSSMSSPLQNLKNNREISPKLKKLSEKISFSSTQRIPKRKSREREVNREHTKINETSSSPASIFKTDCLNERSEVNDLDEERPGSRKKKFLGSSGETKRIFRTSNKRLRPKNGSPGYLDRITIDRSPQLNALKLSKAIDTELSIIPQINFENISDQSSASKSSAKEFQLMSNQDPENASIKITAVENDFVMTVPANEKILSRLIDSSEILADFNIGLEIPCVSETNDETPPSSPPIIETIHEPVKIEDQLFIKDTPNEIPIASRSPHTFKIDGYEAHPNKSSFSRRCAKQKSENTRKKHYLYKTPLRNRPVEDLNSRDFKINPAYNQGFKYAFSEVVRGHSRNNLQGCLKSCCAPQYRALAEMSCNKNKSPTSSQEEKNRTIMKEFLGDNAYKLKNMGVEERRELLIQARTRSLANKHGRHRHAYEAPESPVGIWRADFPSTQEAIEDSRRIKEKEREIVEKRYAEAMRPGGAFKFRDE
ncbi:hypothetical protein BGHDH14_bghG002715000001001 [Blumeria hordei DH14]|uniref:DNA endonuclease activator Ctp1 C-terminal domain-containing protein n=1 Tax=Blumeria graminis f. sp. hordei (strain DH14) TaxID=546991 RepID=N1JAC1_BLUG1|nr:hypothetical protein BGHDH14_bghG002715000001001 [Blumeria hordei DH14]